MKIEVTILIELDDYVLNSESDKEQISYFEKEILNNYNTLFLYSNELGDSLGDIKSVKNIKYIK